MRLFKGGNNTFPDVFEASQSFCGGEILGKQSLDWRSVVSPIRLNMMTMMMIIILILGKQSLERVTSTLLFPPCGPWVPSLSPWGEHDGGGGEEEMFGGCATVWG